MHKIPIFFTNDDNLEQKQSSARARAAKSIRMEKIIEFFAGLLLPVNFHLFGSSSSRGSS